MLALIHSWAQWRGWRSNRLIRAYFLKAIKAATSAEYEHCRHAATNGVLIATMNRDVDGCGRPVGTEEVSMQTHQDDYFTAYRNLKLSRDAKGVLIAEFHSDGGLFTMTSASHTEFVDAFHRI